MGEISKDGNATNQGLVTEARTASLTSPLPVLSWEKSHPERHEWTKFVVGLIGGELFPIFDSARDNLRLHAKFNSLTRDQKIHVWAELISQLALYESGWSPISWMFEHMDKDPVTGMKTKSEGLLQLSYGDQLNYPSIKMGFDWEHDRHLNQNDPKKTIFNPITNLNAGIRILAHQIKVKGQIILRSGVYWSTLRESNGSKVFKILTATNATTP